MKQYIRKKPYLIPLFIILGSAAFVLVGWLLMTAWNLALVPATGANLISFWQAIGLLVLGRLLTGGFGGRKRGGRWMAMKEKWMNMPEEERAKFREQCGHHRGPWMKSQPAQETQP